MMRTTLPTEDQPAGLPARPTRRGLTRLSLLGLAALAATLLIALAAGLFVQATDTAELPNRLSVFDTWTRFWRLALWVGLIAGWPVWLRLLQMPSGPYTVLLGYRWRFAIGLLVFEVLFEQKLLAALFRNLVVFASS